MSFLFTLISLIISIYALVKVRSIESKLNASSNPNIPQGVDQKTPPTISQIPNQSHSPTIPIPKNSPDPFQRLWRWFSHEWPLKTGALFILIGFVWLVSYAFLNNWIGPTGRITFGLIIGALTLFGGERRIKSVQSQGITLVGLGSGIMIISVYAAQEVYQMFPSTVALMLILLTTILTTFISLRHRVRSLAIFALIIGMIAPILIGSTEKSIFGLYSYLLVITLGTIWIANRYAWKILTPLSLLAVTIYSLEYFLYGIFSQGTQLSANITPIEMTQLQFISITFISIFYFTSLASIVTSKKAMNYDLISAAGVAAFSLGWINGLVPEHFKSIIVLFTALSFAFGAYAIYIKTKIPSAVQIYTAISMVLLAIATAYQFDGPVLIIAFSLEALILPIFSDRFIGGSMTKYMLLYFILPFMLSFESITSPWRETNDMVIGTVVTTSFLLSGVYFYYQNKENEKTIHTLSLGLSIIGGIYGLIWIWQILDSLFMGEYTARVISLFLYTIIGLSCYITGEIKLRKILQRFGLGILIYVIGRLLIVEVWDMELVPRIITFFLIGLMFIGSVLLRKTAKNHAQ